jgi:hypothetical protein
MLNTITMRGTIEYPINGTPLEIFVHGDVVGVLHDHEVYVHKIIAKLNKTEVFRYEDGEEKGLLMLTDMSEEIRNFISAYLVELKFYYEQV